MQDASLRCVLQKAKTAKIFYDVGASIGLFSLLAKAVNPSIEIVSVEASTATYGELCRNWTLRPNGWTCVNAALGAEEGSANLSCGLGGLNHVVAKEEIESKANSELRPMTTLDRLAQTLGHSRIDILKVDVEGMELAVLRGAHRLLSEKRIAVIVLEADGHGARYGFSDSNITATMANYGYTIDNNLTEFSKERANCAVFLAPNMTHKTTEEAAPAANRAGLM
jgi:FkbM family methyltransferase